MERINTNDIFVSATLANPYGEANILKSDLQISRIFRSFKVFIITLKKEFLSKIIFMEFFL